ncbi:GNAT family N-acetyltransferase [Nocardioides sp. SR21]|uniref:GNAT family N-acetyltransferase n=1 Tax=Nocardioides sp. SR21 TaxID=2919501 RepID=UPI001FAABF7C|nr:GNAT family N-acetyltransferase [Nocardioides sp. SR21]
MSLTIERVDPDDQATYDAFYDVYLAAERADGDAASPWMRDEMRVALQPRAARRADAFVGRAGGRVVAAGRLETPLLDNLETAEVAVHVGPDDRRQGHASAMLAELEREARARGRGVMQAMACWRYDAGPEGAGESGAEFARARGYTLGLAEVKRRLALPVAAGVLEELAAEVAPHHRGYELRSWVGPVPEELAESWVRLTSTLITEAPTGEMDFESESADVGSMREAEALLSRQGRTKYNTVALDADGEVVAYTDLATTIHEPGKAYQWGTLVRGDARGRRLGLAVKVANLQLLQAERPDITQMTTFNAEVNAHMIGVNERLGFRPAGRLGDFQKRLG